MNETNTTSLVSVCLKRTNVYSTVILKSNIRVVPFKYIADEQKHKGTGDGDVEMRCFGVDPSLLVLKVRPRQVDRQPDIVAPEPLVECDKHLCTLSEHKDTESLRGKD